MVMASSELYENHFFAELQRRDALNSGLSFPVGLITLTAGAIAVMAPRIGKLDGALERTLAIFLALSIACLLVAAFHLVRAYWGYTYKHMPELDRLLAYRRDLVGYFKQIEKDDEMALKLAEAKFQDDVDLAYAQNCAFNSRNNDMKSHRTFLANAFIISAIVAAIVAGPAYGLLSFSSAEETHNVRVINPREFSMPVNENPPPQPVTPPREDQVPQMPVMPPSRDIREHVEPTKTK